MSEQELYPDRLRKAQDSFYYFDLDGVGSQRNQGPLAQI